MSQMIMWVRALAEGPGMNLGDWCPVPITDPAGDYWASRLICSCEIAMGVFTLYFRRTREREKDRQRNREEDTEREGNRNSER